MQKNKYNIAVIPGDGIGTEVMPEALKVLTIVSNKYGINLHFDHLYTTKSRSELNPYKGL